MFDILPGRRKSYCKIFSGRSYSNTVIDFMIRTQCILAFNVALSHFVKWTRGLFKGRVKLSFFYEVNTFVYFLPDTERDGSNK